MKSQILQWIGLGNLDIAYFFIAFLVLILILLIIIIVTMVKLKKLRKKYEKFMLGNNACSLEESIVKLYGEQKALKNSADQNRRDIRNLYKKVEGSFQKCGIVKYDAFRQMGGKLSFSLALLDENNSGFIINSVHSSDGCYSYTKEVINGECNISLGEEEKEALDKAMSVL